MPVDETWVKQRIAEHEQMYTQALATANAHSGAKQAYERMLTEMQSKAETPAPANDTGAQA